MKKIYYNDKARDWGNKLRQKFKNTTFLEIVQYKRNITFLLMGKLMGNPKKTIKIFCKFLSILAAPHVFL